jgi:hypothetical protein
MEPMVLTFSLPASVRKPEPTAGESRSAVAVDMSRIVV